MRWDHSWELRFLTIALLRLGRRAEAEKSLRSPRTKLKQRASHGGPDVLNLESALATASGRFAEGKRLAAEAARQITGRRITQVELAYTAQILASRMEQGRLDEVIAALRQLGALEIPLRAWRAMLAGALADAGDHAEALTELRRLIDRTS